MTTETLLDLEYEAVIGIECHVELKTQSKMFCSCPNIFGGEPNTHICPVCLALPGSLPVPNRLAIRHLMRAGLAVGAEIPALSKFDRKNYFYPDMPKNYQISQFDLPIADGGVVEYWLPDGTRKSCRLERIHLEEDTGKLNHVGSGDGRISGSAYSLVDFNRAGVPLMECVSKPELHTAEDAVAYLEALRRLFVVLGVSDVKMEEGSLRCDANISIRPKGTTALGTKTEVKNMNSFRSIYRAINSEIERQIGVLRSGGRIIQETRGWDEAGGVSVSMRSKEEAHDYRYFQDPDLSVMTFTRELIDEERARLPELPTQRFDRYRAEGLSVLIAAQLIDTPGLALYFDQVQQAGASAQSATNFILGDCSRLANETGTTLADSHLSPSALAELIGLVEAKEINSKIAKEVLTRLWHTGGSAQEIVAREGLKQDGDASTVAPLVAEVLRANAQSVSDFRAGKENALKYLMGQVMKASRGKANPVLVEQILREQLAP